MRPRTYAENGPRTYAENADDECEYERGRR